MKTASLQITAEILALTSEIDEFKGAWRALGQLAPEHLTRLKRIATIESIGSSTRIEGSKRSDSEVEALLGNLSIKKFETPLRREALLNWTHQALEEKPLHPLLIASLFIVEFLAIHPFQDGNGRLSRVLTTYFLLKSGYAYVPYSSLEAVIDGEITGSFLEDS